MAIFYKTEKCWITFFFSLSCDLSQLDYKFVVNVQYIMFIENASAYYYILLKMDRERNSHLKPAHTRHITLNYHYSSDMLRPHATRFRFTRHTARHSRLIAWRQRIMSRLLEKKRYASSCELKCEARRASLKVKGKIMLRDTHRYVYMYLYIYPPGVPTPCPVNSQGPFTFYFFVPHHPKWYLYYW